MRSISALDNLISLPDIISVMHHRFLRFGLVEIRTSNSYKIDSPPPPLNFISDLYFVQPTFFFVIKDIIE